MRINDKNAQRHIANYLNAILDERLGGDCPITQAKEITADICRNFGMPDAIVVSGNADADEIAFSLRDPEMAGLLAMKMLVEMNSAKATAR